MGSTSEDDQRLRFALDHLSTDALRGLSERCFAMFVDGTVHLEWLLAEARKLEDGTVHPWWPRLLRNMRRRGHNPAQIEQTLAAMRTKYPGLMHKIEPPDVEDSE